jgi:putative transcriptional regulator
MSKKAFDKIAAGINDAIAIARGDADPTSYRVHVPAEVDVRKIRVQLKMSQAEFAARFGLSAATVRDWEQNRRKPEGAARVLLQVIKKDPDAVSRALADA